MPPTGLHWKSNAFLRIPPVSSKFKGTVIHGTGGVFFFGDYIPGGNSPILWIPGAGYAYDCGRMDNLPKPEVIITHESDLDGLVAGVLLHRLARKLFREEIPLEAYHYNSWRQREPREKSAWVTDLTFEQRLDRPGWVVIDHHVTEVTPRNAKLVHDICKSAGLLCYELCRNNG